MLKKSIAFLLLPASLFLSHLEKISPKKLSIFYFIYSSIIIFFLTDSSFPLILSFIPDDAFYYLEIVKNRHDTGIWSFDNENLSTGFHLLFAYFLLFIEKYKLNFLELFQLFSIISLILLTISFYLTAQVCQKYLSRYGFIFILIPFCSYTVIIQNFSLMESPLVIFFSSLIFYLVFISNKDNIVKNKIYIYLFFTGFLGSLSRSDFGLLSGILFLSSIICFKKHRVTTFVALMGSITGTLFVIYHSLLITGELQQDSAQIKLFWSELKGHTIITPLHLVSKLVNYGNIQISIILFFSLSLLSAKQIFKLWSAKKIDLENLKIPIISITVVISYVILYKFNSAALSIWYTSNFLVPFSLVFAFIVDLGTNSKIKMFAIQMTFIILIYSFVQYRTFGPFPWHLDMYEVSQKIKILNNDNKIGTWNAGIISYFSEKNIINLDGLMNTNIIPYIKNNSLKNYIEKEKINVIIDYSFMFEKQRALRGGYFNHEKKTDELSGCFNELDIFDGQKYLWESTKIKYYEKINSCTLKNPK